MHRTPIIRNLCLCLVLALSTGCFSERSFTVDTDDVIHLRAADPATTATTRLWLQHANQQLRKQLPPSRQRELLTEELTDARGRPIDVFRHFKKYRGWMHTLIGNAVGLSHTAQVTGDTTAIDKPAPPWDGFEDVWIPVGDNVQLSGRIGFARKGDKIPVSNCIVLLPGLLGDNMRTRARDIGQALRGAGLHVLSLEFRGHGQTEKRFPEVYYNFGVFETRDLLAVSAWLKRKPEIRHTGLFGFSWSANIGLLTAWEEGRRGSHPNVSDRVQKRIPQRPPGRHYQAGILAVSPVLAFEEIMDTLDTPWAFGDNPVLATVQGTIDSRIRRKNHPPANGSLRKLIQSEFSCSSMNYPGSVDEGAAYLRLREYRGKPSGTKLQDARVPVLILHGANDPLAYAQEIADFFAETSNPNVAGLILPGGGHDGFAAYAGDYFYSLILNFFHPVNGPRGAEAGRSIRTTETQDEIDQVPLAAEE